MHITAWPIWALPSLASPSGPLPADPADPPVFHELGHETTRTLVGDWEPPHTLVLVATSLWPETMASFLARALDHVDVMLLADETVSAEPDSDFPGLLHTMSLRTTPVPNTPWIRDYGPLQVREATGEVVWLDNNYSFERIGDDGVPTLLAHSLGVAVEDFNLPLDGGAIASNGAGLCVSTLEFFSEQNIDFEPETLDLWMDLAGCQWLLLVNGLAFDDTRHVDMFLQFTDENTVAIAAVDESDGPDHWLLDAAAQQLRSIARVIELDLTVERVDMPFLQGRYFPYLNMVQLESAVLVPDYPAIGTDDQRQIHAQIGTATGKQVVPVPIRRMVELNGSLHCAAVGLVD